jgi:hypothetical protein
MIKMTRPRGARLSRSQRQPPGCTLDFADQDWQKPTLFGSLFMTHLRAAWRGAAQLEQASLWNQVSARENSSRS